jgi:hypothetical protein
MSIAEARDRGSINNYRGVEPLKTIAINASTAFAHTHAFSGSVASKWHSEEECIQISDRDYDTQHKACRKGDAET